MAGFVNVLAIILFLTCWFFIIKKLIQSKYLPVKAVKAEVLDKYKLHTPSEYPKIYKPEHYMVVFKTKDTKLSFRVSEFTYNNYKVKEKGTLQYRGNQIISFK